MIGQNEMHKTWVKAGDEWVPVSSVEFLDIEEGPFGDIMTFEHEGMEWKSQVVSGSRPG